MNIASIEVLLRVVHHSLVKKYEENVLQRNDEMSTISQIDEMRTISQICEEYKKITKSREQVDSKHRNLNLGMLIGLCILIFATSLAKGMLIIPFGAVAVILWALLLSRIYFGSNKKAKIDAKLTELGSYLEQFREAVHALIPQEVGLGVYSETTIRKGLQMLALEVVAAEKGLDDVRLEKVRLFTEIKFYCDRIEEGQNRLNSAIAAAEEFGVTVNKAELFKAAEQRIKQDSK